MKAYLQIMQVIGRESSIRAAIRRSRQKSRSRTAPSAAPLLRRALRRASSRRSSSATATRRSSAARASRKLSRISTRRSPRRLSARMRRTSMRSMPSCSSSTARKTSRTSARTPSSRLARSGKGRGRIARPPALPLPRRHQRQSPAGADDEHLERRRACDELGRHAGVHDHAGRRTVLPRGTALGDGGLPCAAGAAQEGRADDGCRR